MPLRPASRHPRAYPETDDIDLTGLQVLLALELPVEAVEDNGWIKAATIAAALAEHLATPA